MAIPRSVRRYVVTDREPLVARPRETAHTTGGCGPSDSIRQILAEERELVRAALEHRHHRAPRLLRDVVRPDEHQLLQGHAAWHLLCAAASGLIWLYWRTERPAPSP